MIGAKTAWRWTCRVRRGQLLFAVAVGVPIIWIGLLRLLPASSADDPAAVVPLVVLTNLHISAFYLATVLLVLDRHQGGIATLVASMSNDAYLWTTVASLTFLGVAQNIAIVSWVFGSHLHWGLFAVGCSGLCVLYLFAALSALAPRQPTVPLPVALTGWATIFTSPLISYYDIAPWWAVAWHPFMPSLRLLEAACRDARPPLLALPILGSATWCGIVLVLARRRVMDVVATAAT